MPNRVTVDYVDRNYTKQDQKVDDRLHNLETQVWLGFAAVVILQAVILIFMMVCVYNIYMLLK